MVTKLIVNGETAIVGGGSSNDGARVDFVAFVDRINTAVGETCYVDGSGIDVDRLKLGQRTSGIFVNADNELELVTGTISSIDYEMGGEFNLDVEVRTKLMFPYIKHLTQGDINVPFYLTARNDSNGVTQYIWTKQDALDTSSFVTTDELEQAVSDKVTMTQVNSAVNTAVADKATMTQVNSAVNTAVADKVTTTQLNTAVSDKVTISQMNTAISNATSDKVTSTQLNNATSDKVTTTQMNTAISNATSDKVTTTQMNTAISNATSDKVTTSQMNTAISNATSDKVTTSQMNTAISNATSGKVTTAQMNTAISNATSDKATMTQVNAAIAEAIAGALSASY